MDGTGVEAGLGWRMATRIEGGQRLARREAVAVEAPVGLVYNGLPHAVMMATPADLDDFGLGFSFSESIIAAADDLFATDIAETPEGLELRMTLSAARFTQFRGKRRGIVGRTGCGLCGIESLAEMPGGGLENGSAFRLDPAALRRAVAALPDHQRLNAACGGLHAAAFAAGDGAIVAAREDVGRHNALDKLIGALLRTDTPRGAGFVVLSSRASYEMVDKAARAGVPVVVAVSAPTTLAIDRAEAAGVTLVSFARGDRFTIYSHPERIGA